MRPKDPAWCLDCRWLSIRVPVDGSTAYFCESNKTPLAGAVTWRRPCDRFTPRSCAGRP